MESSQRQTLNPLSSSVALANLDLLAGTDAMTQAVIMGAHLREGLQRLVSKFPRRLCEVRGLGLMQGLVTREYAVAKRIYDGALRRGVLLRISKDAKGETLLLKPSLLVTAQQINKVLEEIDNELTAIH